MSDELEKYLESLEDDDDTENKPPEFDPKKFGYAFRQEQKARKSAEKKIAELEAFQAGVVAERQMEALKAAGLSEFHAEAFGKFFPEVNEENLAAYRVKAGLTAATEETEEEEATGSPAPVSTFRPTAAGEAPGVKMWQREEWLKLAGSDPQRAQALLHEGKVDLSDVRAGLGPDR